MKVHELKAWPECFANVKNGHKTFEIRRDDRKFERGDIVVLREFLPPDLNEIEMWAAEHGKDSKTVGAGYTGRSVGPFKVGYIERSSCLPAGWCGFSLVRMEAKP